MRKLIGCPLGDVNIACQVIDASMLAKMGALLELEPDKPKSEILHDLKEILTGKRALIKDRTAAEARLATATQQVLRQQLSRRLRQVSKDLEQIDDALETMIAADPNLGEKVEILTSIPGIGKATAFALIIAPLMIFEQITAGQ